MAREVNAELLDVRIEKAQEESKVGNGQNSVENKQSKRKNCLKKLEMPGNLC